MWDLKSEKHPEIHEKLGFEGQKRPKIPLKWLFLAQNSYFLLFLAAKCTWGDWPDEICARTTKNRPIRRPACWEFRLVEFAIR